MTHNEPAPKSSDRQRRKVRPTLYIALGLAAVVVVAQLVSLLLPDDDVGMGASDPATLAALPTRTWTATLEPAATWTPLPSRTPLPPTATATSTATPTMTPTMAPIPVTGSVGGFILLLITGGLIARSSRNRNHLFSRSLEKYEK